MLGPLLIIGAVPPPKGGVSIHVHRLSKALEDRSIRHEILDESRSPNDGVANLRRMSPWMYWRTMRRARLVHIHSSNPLIRLAHTVVAKLRGSRIVQTVHGLRGSSLESAALRLAGMLSHKAIGVNATIARKLGSDAVTIPAFIAPRLEEEIAPEEIGSWHSEQKAKGRNIVAVNASRTEIMNGCDLYGLDMMIEVFHDARIQEAFAAIICIASVRGFEQYHAEIERRVATLGLGDQFKIVLGQSNFPAVLRLCDLFVRPTTTDGDAISVREALWYDKPVIASDSVLRPPGTILFRSRDVGHLLEKVLSVGGAAIPSGERRDFANDVIHVYEAVWNA